jgi:signal transduction histidine kinase
VETYSPLSDFISVAVILHAEKANLAKSHFISRMSHELRTPLNVILGYAQLMESCSIPPPRQMIMLKEIINGGWYLLDLIDKILDLGAIESGKMTVTRELVCVTEVMAECRTMIEPQAQERNIQLISPSLDTCLFAKGDRTGVKQILINFLSNASNITVMAVWLKWIAKRLQTAIPGLASATRGRDCLRKNWHSFSSNSTDSDKRPALLEAQALAWW